MPSGVYKHKSPTNETKKKMSESALKSNNTGRFKKGCVSLRKGKPSTMKGKHHREETKQKIRIAHIGKMSPLRGRCLSEVVKHKMSEAQRGSKGSGWRGGISQTYLKKLSDRSWDKIRKKVYERDKWTCQICGKHCQAKDIQCHHITPYRISHNDDMENLITLCRSCHMREEWKHYRKGRRFIGIEISLEYCQVAIRRLGQGILL